MKKKVVLVVGTRPEAIKMAPLYLELKTSETLRPFLLSTGQHQQMLEQALAAFDVQPDLDLKLMAPGQQLVDLTARVLKAVHTFLEEYQPAAVLVQGDTTSVFAASLAAAFANIPVGHVEAGLRTYNMRSPWPEEMNRRLTSPLCRWAFAPTTQSRANLLEEKIPASNCFVTGNTVIDALLMTRERVQASHQDAVASARKIGVSGHFANEYFGENAKPFLLITGHRRESFGSGFENICTALLRLSQEHPELGLLYPVHLNPAVQEPVHRLLGKNPQIELIAPVGYEDFVWLMDRSEFILSDSGGVQEEAPSLGKPVLVMRETTERPEGVTAGTCTLVGTDVERIVAEANVLLGDATEMKRRSELRNPYGDGTACRQIRLILERGLS
ncbi:MAG: UDP-N-acetylglucosamine 2-epimerase (non-hydrolyzing) [Pirellulaceae bacterium]